MYFQSFALLFMLVFWEEVVVAERRYCGTALVERVMEVCAQTDCGTVDEIRELEISLRCCRRRCSSDQIKSYCCYNNYGGSKSLKEAFESTNNNKTPYRPAQDVAAQENF